nr:uncharacterized protein LOC109193541 [Ipomoea trifida]
MSSNNSGSVEWIPEVRCWCGEVAPGNGNCRYFEWLDSDVSERVAKVIRGLLKRLDKQETEMQRFQAVIGDQNASLKKQKLDSKFNFCYGFGFGIVVDFDCFMHLFVIVKITVSLENLIQRIGCPSTSACPSECPSTSACPLECPSTCSET